MSSRLTGPPRSHLAGACTFVRAPEIAYAAQTRGREARDSRVKAGPVGSGPAPVPAADPPPDSPALEDGRLDDLAAPMGSGAISPDDDQGGPPCWSPSGRTV
jgi:hypothetical protein